MVARGDIDGCSFGFMVVEDDVRRRADGVPLRELVDVELFEISPAVAFPAYSASEVALRALRDGKAPRPKTPRLNLARRKFRLLQLMH